MQRIGEQFNGTITGVVPFGLFVTLENLFVEGLLHVSELGVEYFQHNEITHELRGERTGKRHKLYDNLFIFLEVFVKKNKKAAWIFIEKNLKSSLTFNLK